MNQLTREWLQNRISDMETTRDDIPFGFSEDGNNELAAYKLALAAMDSAPVATLDVQSGRPDGHKFALAYSSAAHKLPDDVYFLYRHAQPVPVVSEDLYKLANHVASCKNGLPGEWQDWAEELETDIRRAAMLNGGKS